MFDNPSTIGMIDGRTLAGGCPTSSRRGRTESWDTEGGWRVKKARKPLVGNGFSFLRVISNLKRRSGIAEAAVICQENKLRGGFFLC